MATYRLDVEYEGTRYHGWQEQKNARSVAGELRRAVGEAGADLIELAGSGRTDAGVHALDQTAHLRLRQAVDPEAFRRRLNDALPQDIHVLALTEAAPGFHARHAAVARSYLYQIARRRTGLGKRWVWWVRDSLDVARMTAAAARLPGRHDFVRFCERPAEQESTIVVVDEATVAEHGDLLLVRLVASHFLWKMVRRLVGTLVEVGRGTLDEERFARLLAAEDAPEPGPAQWTAPPSGLFLDRVLYPGEPPLGPLEPAFAVRPAPPPSAAFTGPAAWRSGPRPPKREHERRAVAPTSRRRTPPDKRGAATGRVREAEARTGRTKPLQERGRVSPRRTQTEKPRARRPKSLHD